MMLLVLPASMTVYSLLNLSNWLTYEMTGKRRRILIYNNLTLLLSILQHYYCPSYNIIIVHLTLTHSLTHSLTPNRLHLSCYPFLPSFSHFDSPNLLLFPHNFACQGVRQFARRFFENGVEDPARACHVWDDG